MTISPHQFKAFLFGIIDVGVKSHIFLSPANVNCSRLNGQKMLVNKQRSGFNPGGLSPPVHDVLDVTLTVFGLQTQHGHMPAIIVFGIFSLSWPLSDPQGLS